MALPSSNIANEIKQILCYNCQHPLLDPNQEHTARRLAPDAPTLRACSNVVCSKFCMRIHVDMVLMARVPTKLILGLEKDIDHIS